MQATLFSPRFLITGRRLAMAGKVRIPISLLIAACFAATAGLAGTGADLKGRVTDRGGQPLPGATVTIRNDGFSIGERGTVTDATGSYRFLQLPPGTGYRVLVAMAGHAPVEFSDIVLSTGQTYSLDAVLRPASEVQETVRVRARARLVDPEAVTTSSHFTSEFIAGLPVLGRDYQDILTLAPGVTDVNNTGNPNAIDRARKVSGG